MKCENCGSEMRVLTYSPLLLNHHNHNEAKRTVRGVCLKCGQGNKWREVFTLASEEILTKEEKNYA